MYKKGQSEGADRRMKYMQPATFAFFGAKAFFIAFKKSALKSSFSEQGILKNCFRMKIKIKS